MDKYTYKFSSLLLCLIVGVFTLTSGGTLYAEEKYSLAGSILLEDQSPAIGAVVSIESLNQNTVTDLDGMFRIDNVVAGKYNITMTYLGQKQVLQSVAVGPGVSSEGLKLKFDLKSGALDEVTVIGLTENELVNRQAYNVSSIDAKKLYNTTLDLAHALDRVAGVRIRETGGVGSSMSFSLNGFSGRQVKIFLDGVPMESFGSSFQMNNIPINLAERVEVYKGVVPIWLGSDALGGAVNIVTGSKMRNYLDVSYSYGSFNTHRSTLNAAVTSKKGFTAQISAFQNYSDNNYKVTLDVADINTGAYTRDATVRRFHDQYHNESIIANVGVRDQGWADMFLVGITLGQNRREVQTGARMTSVFGSWFTQGNIVMPTFKYQKNDFIVKNLNFAVNGNYNLGKEQIVDTQFRRYDWYGNYKEYPGPGGERSRSLYKYGNNTAILTSTLTYAVGKHSYFAVNNVLSSFNRKGFDELDPASVRLAQPQKAIKNILGASYRYSLHEKWVTTIFAKLLYQNAHTRTSYTDASGEVWVDRYNKIKNPGYGIATSYFIKPEIQAKLSFERTNRLPDNLELFGDLITQGSSFDLKPERSNNVNLGFTFSPRIRGDHQIIAEITGTFRDARDFIYLQFNKNQTQTVAANREGVRGLGGEFELRYAYKNRLHVNANATYLDLRNTQKYESGYTRVSPVYMDRMPNIPYLFGNAGVSYSLDNLLDRGDNLSIGYGLFYVHAFYLYWPSRGSSSEKQEVPMQLSHDLNITYTMKDGRYNLALECHNLTDALLYDNFSLQKPGRAFNIKLRYFLRK